MNNLEVLPLKLQLGLIHVDNKSSLCFGLTKLLYFTDNVFFSYSLYKDSISLIIQQEHVELFDLEKMTLLPTIWRPLLVTAGEHGTLINVVRAIAEPLAAHRITIFQVSTYEADYTLVPEHLLYHALNVLAPYFHISKHLDDVPPSSPSMNVRLSAAGSSSATNKYDCVTDYDIPLVVASIPDQNWYSNTHSILKLMLFDQKQDFFSITKVNRTNSLILPHEHTSLFKEDQLLTWADTWRLIQIGDGSPLGFDECGIVADFTFPLEQKEICICYLSMYLTDFVLVSASEFQIAMDALKETRSR